MRLLLLVNSRASSVTPRGRVVIQKALSADHQVTMAETSRRGHATRLAQGAAASGVDAVVVLGGDGTLNEAANGLAGSACALAPLPGGSTNVFARTVGLPNDPIEATGVLLDALARRSVRRVGLGSVNGRYFLFHTGVGFDAAVVEQVERRSGLKRYAGHPLFVYAGFDTWIRHFDRSRPRLAVHHADGSVVDDGYLTIVLNTNPYTYLGNRPLDVAAEATLDRGLAAQLEGRRCLASGQEPAVQVGDGARIGRLGGHVPLVGVRRTGAGLALRFLGRLAQIAFFHRAAAGDIELRRAPPKFGHGHVGDVLARPLRHAPGL